MRLKLAFIVAFVFAFSVNAQEKEFSIAANEEIILEGANSQQSNYKVKLEENATNKQCFRICNVDIDRYKECTSKLSALLCLTDDQKICLLECKSALVKQKRTPDKKTSLFNFD